MAPIPTIQKKKPQQQPQQTVVSTDNVYDYFGRPLDSLLRRQKRTDQSQSDNITVNRQHASQYESDLQKDKLIYRDVFPGRKYKLTLSDTTWITGSNTVTIGWTVGDTFTSINYDQDGNVFSFELDNEPAIDTVEVRLVGASDTVRGYLEDATTSTSIKAAIAELIQSVADLISGQSSMQSTISSMQGEISSMQDAISSLDDRVTALENE